MNAQIGSPGTVFVSYAHEDRQRVDPLLKLLATRFSVWWDEAIEPGTPWRQVIQTSLDEASCVVVVWTVNSVRSTFVLSEADKANLRGVLVPVLLDGDNRIIPVGFTELQYADLRLWDGTTDPAIERLLVHIQALVAQGPAPADTYPGSLARNNWAIDRSLSATTDLSGLTARMRSIGEILLPGPGAGDLLGALREVYHTYRVVNTAIRDFISPAVGTGHIASQPFVDIERGTLRAAIRSGRGHCSHISTYYYKYAGLRDQVKGKLPADELAKADDLFGRLGTADGDLFAALVDIGDVLTQEARAIVNLLLAEQEDAARTRILAGRTKLEPLEQRLAGAMDELQGLAESLGYAEPL